LANPIPAGAVFYASLGVSLTIKFVYVALGVNFDTTKTHPEIGSLPPLVLCDYGIGSISPR
jgi:hypothetical protein